MHPTKLKQINTSVLIFIIAAPLFVLWYATYVFNPFNSGNLPLYIAQIFADSISILIIGSLWLTILLDIIQPEHHKRKFHTDSEWYKKTKPKIDVFITVLNEPISIVENTVKAARDMKLLHNTYILDDGNSSEVKELASKLKVKYITRGEGDRKHAKAGNINFGLNNTNSDFFAVFDADFSPNELFLERLLPYFENPKVALVQSPQFYTNTDNFIASGASQAQEVFYQLVQPAKNSYNSAFCVGTNMVYRTSAIKEIGGIASLDHSEDIWTSIRLHEHKFESVFHNEVLAYGRAPETIQQYFRQQNRWARGGFSLLLQNNPLINSSLTADQRLQYFFSNVYYLSGFAIAIYLIIPILYLLFDIHPMKLTNGVTWAIHYIPFFITIYILPMLLVGKIKISTMSTAVSSFFPYLKSFLSSLIGASLKWIPTEALSKGVKKSIVVEIWPHILILFITIVSILVGWYNPIDQLTTAITTFWVSVNAYLIFVFIKNGLISNE